MRPPELGVSDQRGLAFLHHQSSPIQSNPAQASITSLTHPLARSLACSLVALPCLTSHRPSIHPRLRSRISPSSESRSLHPETPCPARGPTNRLACATHQRQPFLSTAHITHFVLSSRVSPCQVGPVLTTRSTARPPAHPSSLSQSPPSRCSVVAPARLYRLPTSFILLAPAATATASIALHHRPHRNALELQHPSTPRIQPARASYLAFDLFAPPSNP
jgi:hypothetical protein